MANYRIVPATAADYDIITEIAHETWPVAYRNIITPPQMTYMLDMMYSPQAIAEQVAQGHVFHLLLQEEASVSDYASTNTKRFRPVAYVSHQLDYEPGKTKIHKLYARPQVQGEGYGRAMVEHVAALARKSGQHTVRLDVNYQNKALGFYEHLGFQKILRRNTEIGHGYLMEDWVMELPL